MATVSDANAVAGGPGTARPLVATIDRWIYLFMAVFLTATVLIGFVPDSLTKIALLQEGKRAPFPPALHVHAVLMGSWMLLLLAQTTLMATGRRAMHMQLGVAGMVLAPSLVLAGIWLVPVNARTFLDFAQSAPADIQAQIPERLRFIANIALLQTRVAVCFLGMVWLALRARKRDSGLHKRLMILATIVPMPAAIDRITWLPHTLPQSPLSADLWLLVCVAPMFLWDLYRQGTIHRAYWIYAAFMVPGAVFINVMWDSPWWHSIAPGILYG